MGIDPRSARAGVVVGLEAEARIARRLGLPVEIGGGGAAGAETAAARLVAAGARGLISFGLCGGLMPGLKAGALLVPGAILHEDGSRHQTDAELNAWLGGATPHVMLAATRIVSRAAEKSERWQATGATAVDLESGAVARAAVRHGLPYACLRAVCDIAEDDLPAAAIVSLDSAGRIRIGAVVWSVISQPGQLGALIALAANAAAARQTLKNRVRRVGALPPQAFQLAEGGEQSP